jgi:hypothetical protein
LCSHSVDFQHFMEPEGSLPSSQELSTCTYPEPNQCSPQHSLLSLKGQCYLSTYVSVFLVVSFPLAFLAIRTKYVAPVGNQILEFQLVPRPYTKNKLPQTLFSRQLLNSPEIKHALRQAFHSVSTLSTFTVCTLQAGMSRFRTR